VNRIRIPEIILNQVLTHVRASLPFEAVGLLAGDVHGNVKLALHLKNLGGKQAFLADPYSQFQAERRLQNDGLQLIAIYHSHPEGCAHLSDLDIHYAKQWDCFQLVVAFHPKNQRYEMKAFRVGDNGIIEEVINVSRVGSHESTRHSDSSTGNDHQ
jgi:[CysO sulfur-carrier protein]-S-L-cysteine hydrolase